MAAAQHRKINLNGDVERHSNICQHETAHAVPGQSFVHCLLPFHLTTYASLVQREGLHPCSIQFPRPTIQALLLLTPAMLLMGHTSSPRDAASI